MAFPNELLQRLLSALKNGIGSAFYLGTIDIAHQHVHQGEFFTANHQELAVANNGVVRLRVTTGAANYAHVVIVINAEGKARFKTYSGTTYTAAGTAADGTKLTVFNRLSTGSAPTSTIRYNPTVNVLGTLRGNFTVFAGTGPQSTGSQSGDRYESLLAPNTDVLITLTNVSGSAQDMEMILEWYE